MAFKATGGTTLPMSRYCKGLDVEPHGHMASGMAGAFRRGQGASELSQVISARGVRLSLMFSS